MIKSSKRINILIVIITILFFILFFTSAYFEKNKMLQLYSSGKEKIENQQYQEAQEILGKLGDYKDSLEQIEIAQILEQKKNICDNAIEAFNTENYKDSIKFFKQINDFKTSKEYTDYYINFEELFERIDGFKDSIEYIEKANTLLNEKNNNESIYKEACNYSESKKYILAIQKFFQLNDYKDSEDRFQECRLELARLQQATTISAGIRYSTGIVSDNKIKYSGDYELLEEELSTWKDIISISLKGHLAIGLKQNGTVLVAGKIPDYPDYYIDTSTWEDIIAVSSGQQYIVGLRSDGTLVAQGHNGDKQLDINGSEWSDIVAISCGWRHTVGLDSNGKIHITGFQSESQLENIKNNKDKWHDIVAVSAAGGSNESPGHNAYTAALKQDGKVITTLPTEIQNRIDDWNDIIAISAGDFYLVGLNSKGDVFVEQIDNSIDLDNSINEIGTWNDIIAISAGRGFTLAVNSEGKLFASGFYKDHQIDIDGWGTITRYADEWNSIFDKELRWNGIN